ncbi:iron-sulfur binding protein, ferredoxin-like protein [Halodesulfurarchaeum formicicum]|uniref:Iron-sulfur binding protein, ferredoxin-like protein n=1 Tax=Halodesulfurarchaeum formicicum TaxID=1873524 RepID=A0A1D8S5X4_9EURY|nr:4Fe-4S binding protein [Halodesulfurarchaeum formicicum]AOW80743.1 iron-sulfur binding protein, ferredoxin-like protein [Halodesulfurarchaeum formicicum]
MTVAVISDCRGTADIDRNAVAEAIDVEEAILTSAVADHREAIAERIEDADTDAVLFVAGDGPVVTELLEALEEAGYRTDRVSPFIGASVDSAVGTAVVAGAANAAVRQLAIRPEIDLDPAPSGEHVVVVGDPLVARDLAGNVDVTLIADHQDLAGTSLPDSVTVRRGTATALERVGGGYEVQLETWVTEDCTGCGRCLRRYPEATTDVPVQVTADTVEPAVCPADAIRPADEPLVEQVEASQVVWPNHQGPLAADRWVHTIRTGVAGAVNRAAWMRARPEVTVDHSTCAVGTAGNEGCSACEEACPNDAISISLAHDGGVSIEPDRCVACGTCVSVCPTASIEPTRAHDVATTAAFVEAAIGPVADATAGSSLPWGGSATPFGVVFVSEAIEPAVRATLSSRSVPPVIPIVLPNVLSVSDAVAIYAVALGADGVLLASDPDRATEPVEDAVRQANLALDDLGLGERVAVANTADPDALARAMDGLVADSIDAVETGSVRTDSRHALGLDASVALAAGHGSNASMVAAPGSGTVTVEESGCTLCTTCHDVCPTGALEQTEGQLHFDPEACVGCGHCETACPEDVIDVSPRVPLENGAVPERDVVVEKEMVECRVCGEPFASRAGIEEMEAQLDEAALEALDLEVCPDCRSQRAAETEFL